MPICVQINSGKSLEATASSALRRDVPVAVDADRLVAQRYYVNQILSLDEEGIQAAWHKVW